jgi:hypothetical protein
MASNYTDTTDTNFKGIVGGVTYNIESGQPLSAEGVRNALHTKENVANKTDAIDGSNSSSSAQYPSVKAVDTALAGKQDKITAGKVNDILTKTATAGILGTLTKTNLIRTGSTIDTAPDDTHIPTEKAVVTALNGKADISSLPDTSNLQEKLPVGTILMFDGYGWVDNYTIAGWYACIAANAGYGCPDLVNSFIKGSASAAHTAGGNSGNEVAIGANNLSAHTHDLSGASTGSMSGNSTGNIYRKDVSSEDISHGIIFGGIDKLNTNGCVSLSNTKSILGYARGGGVLHNADLCINVSHTHTLSGSTGNNTTTAAKLNIEPQSYALIFIRKCV